MIGGDSKFLTYVSPENNLTGTPGVTSHSTSRFQEKVAPRSHPERDQTTSATTGADASHVQHDRGIGKRAHTIQHTQFHRVSTAVGQSQLVTGSSPVDSSIKSSIQEEVKVVGHAHMSTAQTTGRDDTVLQTRQQLSSKLGGWRPRKDVASRPQIMTWGTFNNMLLKVGQARESNAQQKALAVYSFM